MKKNIKNLLFERIKRLKKAGLTADDFKDASIFDKSASEFDALKPSQTARLVIEFIRKVRQKPAEQMIAFIMYDISDNKVRTEISKYLVRAGLSRVQKSVFLGSMKREAFEKIYSDLKEVQELYENEDSIIVVPVSSDDISKMRLIGQNIDIDLATDRVRTLFI